MAADLDAAGSYSVVDPDNAPQPPPEPKEPKQERGVLRRYIESFDEQTLKDTARLISLEGASLVCLCILHVAHRPSALLSHSLAVSYWTIQASIPR